MSDGVTIRIINAAEIERWFGNWVRKTKQTKEVMRSMAVFYLQQIFRTFNGQGARDGFPKWPGYNRDKPDKLGSTTRTKTGTWNIRYGTDKNPKRTATELAAYKTENNLWFKRGPMKGYRSDRRYYSTSKMLLASGSFRNSFRVIMVGNKNSVVGTTMPKADKIVGWDGKTSYRPVIRISQRDITEFQLLLLRQFLPGGAKA